jgi:hypothetical protein
LIQWLANVDLGRWLFISLLFCEAFMKKAKSGMRPNEVAIILYVLAIVMFVLALNAISQSDIWGFLSWLGLSLALALGPKEPDFYKSPIRKWSDLNSISFSTDALSGAILMVAFICIIVGLLGEIFLG